MSPQAIGMALFQIGAPLWLATAAVTATGAAVINAAIGIGLSLVAQTLLGQPTTPKPSDGQQTIKQPVAPRRKSYGLVRVSGSIWWFDRATSAPDKLYVGLVLNHGQIGEFVQFHIDDNPVKVDSGTYAITTSPYNDASNPAYLHYRLGLPTETSYAPILTRFGIDNCRGDGLCTVLGVFDSFANAEDQLEAYPNGAPQIRATIKASLCFDPRNPAHSPTDGTTWTWSDNAAVCLFNYLFDPDGYGLSYDLLDRNLAAWKAAMDIADEYVTLAEGGRTRRYRCAVTYNLTDNPKDVVQRFLDCMDAKIWVKRDGSIGISVGRFVTPTVTITDDDITGYSDLTYGQDPVTSIAGIRAQYMSPDDDFREHEAEPWPNAADVTALGEERVAALDLLCVPSHNQARRLMKRAYKRATAGWRGTIRTNLAGLRAIDERYIRLELSEFGIAETFEVQGFSLDLANMGCQLDLLAVDSSIDDFDAATEESPEDTRLIFGYAGGLITTDADGTFNPISLVSGKVGQVCVVLVHNSTGATLASGPSSGSTAPDDKGGWVRIANAGPTSSNAVAAYARVVDGTEGNATFCGSAVGVAVLLFDGMVDGYKTQGESAQVTTAAPTTVVQSTRSQPYAVIEWMASDSAGSLLGQSALLDPKGNDATEASDQLGNRAFRVTTFGYPEDPVDLTASMNDVGTNGFLSFILRPL